MGIICLNGPILRRSVDVWELKKARLVNHYADGDVMRALSHRHEQQWCFLSQATREAYKFLLATYQKVLL